jgi:4-alpha-glucanotransferase
MKFKRSSGVLLHPTSLPGRYGIGDIGPAAHRWLDFLDQAGCRLWQVLPLGPTGYGDSPYQCFSAFAGNPYLISPEALLADGLLLPDDLADLPDFPKVHVDFGPVINWKLKMLDRSYKRFASQSSSSLKSDLNQFRAHHASWLDDFALFMAIKEAHGGASWATWEPGLRDRQPEALKKACQMYQQSIEQQIYRQFVFFRQWERLRDHARAKDIKIIGDIPIFVAHDSADVWANRDLFYINKKGKPKVVAGVPPDYFSPTGQLWGNPLYRWKYHKTTGYAWWLARFRAVLELVDIVRLDHFRGFAGYWEVPGNATTAENGRWVPGPRSDFFKAIKKGLGDLPIIAEDLGVITDDVNELRDQFDLPGMKILQFAFAFGGDSTDPFFPHNYETNCVAYTGTHDNDTSKGLYERLDEKAKSTYRRYMDRDGSNFTWDLIRGVWASVAVFALTTMQDLLNLGNEARMNYPGNPSGNWSWRMVEDARPELAVRLREFNTLYSRLKSNK